MGLFGFGSKSFTFNCPMCKREYKLKFNPSAIEGFDYAHGGEKHSVLAKQPCGFCKTEMTVLFSSSYTASAIDEKWLIHYREVDNKVSDLESDISEIESEIQDIEESDCDDPNNEKKIAVLQSKLPKLKATYEKMQAAFEKMEDDRMERESRWEDKYLEKHGR